MKEKTLEDIKTLQFFKDQVAQEFGHKGVPLKGWQDMEDKVGYLIGKSNLAAQRYAAYAFELACNLTKEKCAEAAKATSKCSVWNCQGESVDKDSILNCESPINPFKP